MATSRGSAVICDKPEEETSVAGMFKPEILTPRSSAAFFAAFNAQDILLRELLGLCLVV